MLLGEIIKRSGFPKDTIRFYEKKGLITLNRKDRRENNYKEYSEEILERLIYIKSLKSLGFTLNEIIDVLELKEMNEVNCQDLMPKFNEKIDKINDQIKLLENLKSNLLLTLNKCKNNECTIENNAPSCIGKSCN